MAADKFDTGENAIKVSKVGGINLRKKGFCVTQTIASKNIDSSRGPFLDLFQNLKFGGIVFYTVN